MKYFKNTENGQVYGYDADQQDLVQAASDAGWQEITGSWPPPPSDDDLKAQCKAEAKRRLLNTDYTQMSDVAVALTNKGEFDTYRSEVRTLFLTPVTHPTWPVAPIAIWRN
jgi:hypothetical protein